MQRYDFLNSNYNVSCGLAFKLYLLSLLIYLIGHVLSNILCLTDLYKQENKDLSFLQQLFNVFINFCGNKNNYSPAKTQNIETTINGGNLRLNQC